MTMVGNILFMAIHIAIAVYFLGRFSQTKKNDLLYWLAFNVIFAGIQFSIANEKYNEKFSNNLKEHLQEYHQTTPTTNNETL